MEKYHVITIIEGETTQSIKNTRELAELWREDQDCGMIDTLIAFRYNPVTATMEQINVYEVATEYLNEQEEMQKEYDEYTEYVEEYGYDYQDQLEMGFDPYMGCYSDDC